MAPEDILSWQSTIGECRLLILFSLSDEKISRLKKIPDEGKCEYKAFMKYK